MFDLDKALSFLSASRSRLVREAARWLVAFDDPVDLLFILSRDTAEAMGPFDTFRYAALLGLGPAAAVRELGLDVLAEPVDEDSQPPLHHALALAWAKRAFPEEPAPHAGAVLSALRTRKAAGAHPALIAASELALLPLVEEDAGEVCARLAALLEGEDGPAVAPTIYEALWLAGLEGALTGAALARMREGQQDDGGLSALLAHPVFRGLTTLRAVCLVRPRPRA